MVRVTGDSEGERKGKCKDEGEGVLEGEDDGDK